ncbi:MarR family winged helix-turn-helix transcriptional regulator [Lactobacillus hominis]|nr:MarR family transcriptional regulator [Lactobacillus hominis]MCT3347342.1 MarR family transcriptional regulator [Lactobacillus hominis]
MADKVEKFSEVMDQFRSYIAFSKRFYGDEIKLSNVTPQQGRTLMYIQANPGIIQRELADNFHLRNASVTNMLKNLERDGYIERKQDEKSARIKRIYITDLGKQQVVEIEKKFDAILKKLSERVDEGLIDQLLPLLKELNKEVRK